MKGGKRYGSARGMREAGGERLERAIADEEAVVAAAEDLERTGEADAPPIRQAPAEGPAAQRAEGDRPRTPGGRFIGGLAGTESSVLDAPSGGTDEVEALLGPPPAAALEAAKAITQGKRGKDAYPGYEPPEPDLPAPERRILDKPHELEAVLLDPDAYLAFRLPEGAVLNSFTEDEMLHLGNGVFIASRPPTVIEGRMVRGGRTDRAWPSGAEDGEQRVVAEWVGAPPAYVEGADVVRRVAPLVVRGPEPPEATWAERVKAAEEHWKVKGWRTSLAFDAAKRIALAHPAAADALPPSPDGVVPGLRAGAPIPPEFGGFVRSVVERRVRHALEGFILDAPAALGPPPPLDEHVAVRVEPKEGLFHPDVVLEARTPYGAELVARYRALEGEGETDAA